MISSLFQECVLGPEVWLYLGISASHLGSSHQLQLWEPRGDGLRTWVPATLEGVLDSVSGSCLWPDPILAVV